MGSNNMMFAFNFLRGEHCKATIITQLFLSLEIILCNYVYLILQLKLSHALCWSVPCITPLGIRSSYFFENVVLGSLKSSSQLDHQANISLYITGVTTLCPLQAINQFEPHVESHKSIGFQTFNIHFILVHFIGVMK